MTLDSLTHGTNGLLLAYGTTLAGVLSATAYRRCSFGQYIGGLIFALPCMLGAAALASLLTWKSATLAALLQPSWSGLFCLMVLYFAVGGLGVLWLMRRRTLKVALQRGTVLTSGKPNGRSRAPRGAVTLAGIPIPLLDETKHFKLLGTTGSGKSTAIRELLTGALGRGDRAIIADPDGGYLARFYDAARGDLILNPFDGRSVRWDLFGEIEKPQDVEQLARSLIPEGAEDSGREWRGYARTFLGAVLEYCKLEDRGLAELWRLVTVADADELKELLAGSAAQPFLAEGAVKMFHSIRSTATPALSALKYVKDDAAAPLSVRQWVREGKGVLFLPYSAGEIAALRNLIATWLRLAIFETMCGGEGDRRLWFVIDELDALGQIDGLKDALARLRKFGGRCVLGFQSIAQVRGTNGDADAQTIVENCGNTLILRCSASERGGTAEFASRLIGKREVIRQQESLSRPVLWGGHASRTLSTQQVVEDAVMASEIEQLPDLAGYLKVASRPEWRCVRLMSGRSH
ncbi:MAG: type IV secretion system DNA-binding domain-containing protein [Proteobacteria bacterium]|nr:type IV secretion system DNA-binding domain-containing protein [Pseudomonadota bacterium]